MWAYAMNYISDYDFFHIMGDDGYLYVDNFRAYLDSDEVIRLENGYLDAISNHEDFVHKAKNWTDIRPRPLILGTPVYRRKRVNGTVEKSTFPAGGSGYTLNRAALQLLQRNLLDDLFSNLFDSREDVLLGSMLSSVGVYVSVTFDDHHGGRYIESAENSYRRTEGSPSPTGMGQEMRNRFKMRQADSVDGVRCVRMM